MNNQFKQLIQYIKPYLPMTLLSILLTLPAGALDAVIVMTLKPYMDVIMLNIREFLIFQLLILILMLQDKLQMKLK